MAPRIGGKPPTARPPYPDCKRAGNGNLPQAPKRNLSTLPQNENSRKYKGLEAVFAYYRAVRCEKASSVTPITDRQAGSGMLAMSL
jgi:hypothetical protein